jgi:L-fuconolactonase
MTAHSTRKLPTLTPAPAQTNTNIPRLSELIADITQSGHRIIGTCYMQSSSAGWGRTSFVSGLSDPSVRETEVAQGVAACAESGRLCTRPPEDEPVLACASITASLPLEILNDSSLLEKALHGHIRAGRNFRGVRVLGGKAERIPFGSGFNALLAFMEKNKLVWDVNGPETHPLNFDHIFGGIEAAARSHPRLTIVVNHCGGAIGPTFFKNNSEECWRRWVVRLAKYDNVYMKVGGLQMMVNGWGLENRRIPIGSKELAKMTSPFYEHVIRAFGPVSALLILGSQSITHT